MNRFWDKIILPILQSINAKHVVEIGSDTGLNTKNILEYCVKNNAHLTAIDPFPQFDINDFKNEYGNKFTIYTELSLSRLPLLKDYDAILIDGDHNWYTVYNELKIIEENFKNKKFPIIFFHDIGWPYARRDLYYNPNNIPPVYRQHYKKLGIYPGKKNLLEKGGLNNGYNNSIYENNPKNGVLTAIEDFIDESSLEFTINLINAFHGLGILYPKNKEIEKIVTNVVRNVDFISILEEERVKLVINKIELSNQTNNLEKKLIQTKNKLETTQNLLEKRTAKLEKRNAKLEQNLENIKVKLNQCISNQYESEYLNNKGRSITQRLISQFPSIYILLSLKNYSLKNTIVNIKGYKSIKKK